MARSAVYLVSDPGERHPHDHLYSCQPMPPEGLDERTKRSSSTSEYNLDRYHMITYFLNLLRVVYS